jgi:hypothetical protein
VALRAAFKSFASASRYRNAAGEKSSRSMTLRPCRLIGMMLSFVMRV